MSETEGTSPQPAPSGQPKAGDRRRARALAMQGLYQRHFSKTAISDIEAEFMVDNDMSKVDLLYFRDLLRGVHREQGELDKLIERCDKLEKDNALLRELQDDWNRERAQLMHKNDLAKNKIEAMIGRLRALEHH